MQRLNQPRWTIALLAMLVACKPVSQRDDNATNEPPIADAGAGQTVTEASVVTLNGTASDRDGSIVQVAWQQSSGPAVALADSGELSTNFTAPSISESVVLGFRLSVYDDDGASSSDTVSILVNPDPLLNAAPVADPGLARTVGEGSMVVLDGSGSSDADGFVATYDWLQVPTGAPAVTLDDASAAMPTFIAPDVSGSTDLVFELTVTDNEGAMSPPGRVTITVIENSGSVDVSGRITFDRVLHDANGGLDYDNLEVSPVRSVLVQAIDNGNQAVLATATTDGTGQYRLTVPAFIQMYIRVRAELRESGGGPSWDVRVVDNGGVTSFAASKPLYVLDGASFNSGVSGATVDLHAGSGWDSTSRSYMDARSAAPFAILDVILDALQLTLTAAPDVQLVPLVVNWSPENSLATTSIGTTFYADGQIFVLGAENQDADEYDRHVVAHELGHFLEEAISRSDSVGGSHGLDDRLDARVALSEGWGNAFSAMVTGDETYKDACCIEQAIGSVVFSLEENCDQQGDVRGWYSECSAGALIYDFFDPPPGEAIDTVSLGFQPIYSVLAGALRTTSSLTTLFSFIELLQDARPANATAIDSLVENQNIRTAGQDEYGSAETDSGGNADALPLYRTDLLVSGPPINVCTNADNGHFNAIGNRRFIRFAVTESATYTILATTTDSAAGASPDPDFQLFRIGFLADSLNPPAIGESLMLPLTPGDYVLEIWDDNNISGGRDSGLTPGRFCVDVSVSRN